MNNLTQDIIQKTLAITGPKDLELAHQFAVRFFNELKDASKDIPTKISASECDTKLSMMLHKLAGACAYFGANALQQALLDGERLTKLAEVEKVNQQLVKIHALLTEAVMKETEVLSQLK